MSSLSSSVFTHPVVLFLRRCTHLHREIYDWPKANWFGLVDIFGQNFYDFTKLFENRVVHNFPINYRHPLTKMVANWVCLYMFWKITLLQWHDVNYYKMFLSDYWIMNLGRFLIEKQKRFLKLTCACRILPPETTIL